MTKKEDGQDFGDMLEMGDGFDINNMLEDAPALETDPDDTTEEDTTSKDSDDDGDEVDITNNINQILEKGSKEPEDDSEDTEEETDDNTKDTDGSPAPDKIEKSSSDTPFTVIFAKDLMEQGILSEFDEEEYLAKLEEGNEADAFRSLIQEEVTKNIDAAKSDLDDGYQQYLSLTGQGIDPETSASLTGLQQRFSSISEEDLQKEENDNLRKSILTDYYKLTTRFNDTKIEKLVQNSMDMGDDISESTEALSSIKELVDSQITEQKQEAERQKQLAAQENQRQLEVLKETINSMNEVIPDQRINKNTKNKMYDLITKSTQDKNGRRTNAIWAKRSEDPFSFDAKLAYLLETGFFEKDKPWTKIKTVKTSKEASNLEDFLSSKKNTRSSTGKSLADTGENDAKLQDILRATKSILK